MKTAATCSIPDCDKLARTKKSGWCEAHYYRNRRHGSPYAHLRPELLQSIEERFWSKVAVDGDCLIWQSTTDQLGYAHFELASHTNCRAHRVAYWLVYGPVPDGLVLDHTCRRRSCVNPTHLDPVTQSENVARGESFSARYARRTHCAHGHEYTPENILWKGGARLCRACRADYNAKRMAAYHARHG